MIRARRVAPLVALIGLAAGATGCGGAVGYPGAPLPAHTHSYPVQHASPLPPDFDALSGLQNRPITPPALPSNVTCSASAIVSLGRALPNYGAGVGPAYLSGQQSWYSDGQVGVIMVDPDYSGPLLIRPFQLGGNGGSTVTLADLPATDVVKQEPGVAVVPALHTTGGGLYLEAIAPTASWREWTGLLSTSGPGCFGLQIDGDTFTEFIVIEVNRGAPPGP